MFRPNPEQEHARGLVYIPAGAPFNDAVLEVDLTEGDVAGEVQPRALCKVVLPLPQRPDSPWVPFSLAFSWPSPRQNFRMDRLRVAGRITSGGKLLYLTKVAFPVNMTAEGLVHPTIVVEAV